MSKPRRSRPGRSTLADKRNYLDISKRPLQILAFLFPLVVAYEFGLVLLLRSEHGVLTNRAHETLLKFFAAFGIEPASGFYLGGVAVVVVLLTWHVLSRQRWTIDYPALGIMALESVALAMPLLVLAGLIVREAAPAVNLLASATAPANLLANQGLGAKVAISIGAGLYEELLFRMMLIAVIHTLLVDVGKASHNLGAGIAVVVAAAAFTWYHPLEGPTGELSLHRLIFFFLAGLYFGAIYVVRGFGIVVGVHAVYDVITFMMQSGSDG